MNKYICIFIMISAGILYYTPKSYADDKTSPLYLYINTSSDMLFYYPLQQSPVITFDNQSLSLFIENQNTSFQFNDISSIGYVTDSEMSLICPFEDFQSIIELTSTGFYIKVLSDENLHIYSSTGHLMKTFHIKANTLELITFEDLAKGTYICTFTNHVFKFLNR